MSNEREYAAPPVVEALCEAYFSGGKWDPTLPGLFFQRIRAEFPNRALAQEVGAAPGGHFGEADAGLGSGASRMQFHEKNGSRIVQFTKDLLVVNQLRPYPGFDAWRPVAVEMLSLYRELVRPEKLDRIGLRYINRVVIPKTSFHMSEFFGVYAIVPQELGGEYASFLVRVEVPPIFPDHRLLITLSSEPSRLPGAVEILLDLYDVVGESDRPLLDTFEATLRAAHQNVVLGFENAITPAARRLFKEKTEATHEPRP